MSSKEEKFFDLPTILALIGLIIALPALLIGIFFNKKFDITDKILLVLSALPTIIYGLFYLCIFAVAPFAFMICCFQSDAWPLGVMIAFFMVLLAISFCSLFLLHRKKFLLQRSKTC